MQVSTQLEIQGGRLAEATQILLQHCPQYPREIIALIDASPAAFNSVRQLW